MLIRIVKLSFRTEAVPDFLALFEEYRERIRHQPGCTHLELWQDRHEPSVFFTYSHWEEEQDLERYRHSELFREVWGTTRSFFAAKPEAWSVNRR